MGEIQEVMVDDDLEIKAPEATEAPEEVKEEPKEEPKPEVKPQEQPDNKALARMGYENRQLRKQHEELSRKIMFMEEERKKELAAREREREFNSKQREIDDLREVDPTVADRRQRDLDRERITHDIERKIPQQASVIQGPEAFPIQDAQREVESRLVADFPDITKNDSELFKEAQGILSGYGPQEIEHMLTRTPQMFYHVVEMANNRLELKKKSAAAADDGRKNRVAAQSAPANKPVQNGDHGLDSATLKWCKDNGYDPQKYARYARALSK